MKRFNKLLCFMLVFLTVMVAFCTVSFAATVGQPLTSPEAGWQRFDDSVINYEGSGWSQSSSVSGRYMNYSTNQVSGDFSGIAKFKFFGTKLRVIAYTNNIGSTAFSNNLQITIDGENYSFSEMYSLGEQRLVFNIVDLSSTIHTVSIKTLSSSTLRGLNVDAIDIDDTGYIVGINTPAAPTNLVATPSNSKVDLSWDAVEGATNYILKRSETPGGPYQTITTTSAISYTDNDVTKGTTYYYVASAVNSGSESPNSNEASATPSAPQPTNQLKLVLEVKEEKQLSVSDELSDNTEMDWTSFDSTIATVDANGMVKALKPGNTVITCTSKDKPYTESINVLVVDLEYQLALDLSIGGTCRLTIDDLTNTTFVTWSSYDPTIATVSDKGKVTAVSEGLTYVVASDKDGKEIGRIYVRVRQ